MTILEELVNKGGVIKDTIEGTDIPVLWYSDTSLVDISGLKDDLIAPMYAVVAVEDKPDSTMPIIYRLWRDVTNDVIDKATLVEEYARCLAPYGINKGFVEEVFSLIDINVDALMALSDSAVLAEVCDWYNLLTRVDSDTVVRLEPVQVYLLLHEVMFMLLDEQAYKEVAKIAIINANRVDTYNYLCGYTQILDKDTFPVKDMLYSIWDCYIKMEEAVCFIDVKGGEE